ncbi:MAG: hypothetical protein GTO22_05235 [Gemmatimonadales bacterium]|nr:hypothetical protein [Gemmatimonadales bacterium]
MTLTCEAGTYPDANQFVNASAGTEYSASGYIRTSLSSGSARVRICYYNGSTYLESDNSAAVTGNSGYTYVTANGTAPSGTTRIKVSLQGYPGSGDVWFDDIVLIEGSF